MAGQVIKLASLDFRPLRALCVVARQWSCGAEGLWMGRPSWKSYGSELLPSLLLAWSKAAFGSAGIAPGGFVGCLEGIVFLEVRCLCLVEPSSLALDLHLKRQRIVFGSQGLEPNKIKFCNRYQKVYSTIGHDLKIENFWWNHAFFCPFLGGSPLWGSWPCELQHLRCCIQQREGTAALGALPTWPCWQPCAGRCAFANQWRPCCLVKVMVRETLGRGDSEAEVRRNLLPVAMY